MRDGNTRLILKPVFLHSPFSIRHLLNRGCLGSCLSLGSCLGLGHGLFDVLSDRALGDSFLLPCVVHGLEVQLGLWLLAPSLLPLAQWLLALLHAEDLAALPGVLEDNPVTHIKVIRFGGRL